MKAAPVTKTPSGCRHLPHKAGDGWGGCLGLPRAMLLALLSLLLAPAIALAHAQLVSSNPADSAVMAAPPSAFTLTFNEPVSPITLKLARPDGTVTLLEGATVDGLVVTIPAPQSLLRGSFAFSYRVISEDGHPVGGSIVFSIGAPGGGAIAPAADATPPDTRLLILAQRALLYLGIVFGLGGAVASHWLGASQRAGWRTMRLILLTGTAAAIIGIGAQGLDMLGVSPGALALAAPWRMGLSSSYASTLAGALLALCLALASLHAPARKALSLAGLIVASLAFALSGHASAADPQWLTRPAVFLHVAAVTFWGGALLPLTLALRRGGSEASDMLKRFSTAILPVIIALLASGIALAVVQLGRLEALWTTAYGVVFLVKLALLLPLFVAAAANRVFLTRPALACDGPAPTSRLRLSIAIEILLVAAILATVANWRFTVPPRALALAERRAVAAELVSDKAMAEVTVFPDTAGPVRIAVLPMSTGEGDLSIKELSVTLSNPASGIEAIRRKAEMDDDGAFAVDGLTLPVPGLWHLRVEILISDFEMTVLEGDVAIRP
jgi:copper transport protein